MGNRDMKFNIKLIVTDMDGTLLDQDKNIPPDFPAWVSSHPEIRTAIASGRQYYTLYEEFETFGIADKLIYIAENGGVVMEGVKMLYRDTLTESEVRAALERAARQTGVTPVVCGIASAYMAKNPPENVRAQAEMYYRRLKFSDDLDQCPEIETGDIIKIALYIENNRAAEVIGDFQSLGGRLKGVVSGPDWIDIGNRDVSKGTALAAVQELYQISRDETMGFGDYMNDYEFLERCGESYAMANACPEILKLTKYRTASNINDGVMRILRTL